MAVFRSSRREIALRRVQIPMFSLFLSVFGLITAEQASQVSKPPTSLFPAHSLEASRNRAKH